MARVLHSLNDMHTRLALMLAFGVLMGTAEAKQDSWFHPEAYQLGGHGGPWAKPTTLNDQSGVLGGGVFGISTNPGFSWIVSANYLEADADGLDFGYGAVGWETAFRFHKIVQPMGQVQIGYGLVSHEGVSSGVWVGELEAMLGFKIGKGEKLITGVGYREVEGANGVPGVGGSTLDGWEALVRLDYGIYDAALHPKPAASLGAPVFSGFYSGKATLLGGHMAWLDGGGTMFIFGGRWAAGISGYRTRGDISDAGGTLSMGYGGGLLRYMLSPQSRIHAGVSLLAGAAGLGSVPKGTREAKAEVSPVADADVLLETNLTQFLRMSVGCGYRFVPARFQGLGPLDWGGPTLTAQWATAAF